MNSTHVLKHLNLLFVDDDHRACSEIYSLFSNIFKSISLAHDAKTALRLFKEKSIDIIITDIELPDFDGLTFVERIRMSDVHVPIIILSAYTENKYLLRAANLQIDGYLTKPLSFRKLEAGLTRAIARLESRINHVAIADGITYHPLLKTLIVDNEEVSLGSKECLLLELLINNSHRVVSKAEIQDVVWPHEAMSESALKNLLGELRKKLKYNVISNQPSRGWRLIVGS